MARLQEKLREATSKARKAALLAVVAEVDAVRDDAVSAAPRDTGALEAGIQGRTLGLDGEVRSTARHGGFVEHGTFKDAARPYMAPAAEVSRKRFPARVAAAVKVRLEGIRA
jgi:hypothetical protein